MAPRNPQGGNGGGNDASADFQADVFENFGLEQSDLDNDSGIDDGDTGDDDLGDDRSGDPEPRRRGRDDDYGDDDPDRVTHTRQREDNQQRRPDQRQQDNRQRLPARAEVKPDKNGNLVNAQGQIVARAGKEARFYQEAYNAKTQAEGYRSHITNVETRLNRAVEIAEDLQEQVRTFQARDEQIKQFGITPVEQLEALRLFVLGKQKPVELLKNLLTRAAASGINVNEILGPNAQGQGGFDVSAIAQVLQTELAPLKELTASQKAERERQQQNDTNLAKTREKIEDFFNLNQGARQYLPVFTKVLQDPRYKNMSLEHIWDKIQLNQARTGNRDLRRDGENPPQRRRGMPQGRGTPSGNNQRQGRQGDYVAPVNDSYEKILRETMADYGM